MENIIKLVYKKLLKVMIEVQTWIRTTEIPFPINSYVQTNSCKHDQKYYKNHKCKSENCQQNPCHQFWSFVRHYYYVTIYSFFIIVFQCDFYIVFAVIIFSNISVLIIIKCELVLKKIIIDSAAVMVIIYTKVIIHLFNSFH